MKQCPMCGAAWVQYNDGSSDCVDHCNGLASAGQAWTAAHNAERQAAAHTYQRIQAAALGGLSEAVIARLAGVDRMTVRKALGKR